MNVLLKHLIDRVVRTGNLTVRDSKGQDRKFGDGSGPPVHFHIKTAHAERAIMLHPTLAIGEMFMEGELDFLQGDMLGFLHIIFENFGPTQSQDALSRILERMRIAFRSLQQMNTKARARRNVESHYDLSNDFYRLFLDEDMQYSCAYFERPDMTLEEAQIAKKRHIAAKMKMKSGQTVLDIGSGWGGMGLYLGKTFQADVLGVTLSTEQHAASTDRAREAGLDGHVHFEIKDYRNLSERFDRIVSVGMFEHVGVNHYKTFFDKVATLLKPDGVMLLHSIGRFGPPTATNGFIRKHIFPGGYIPALSEVLPHIERAGLMYGDIEILRVHYGETVRHWYERFMANRDRVKEIYDERFCRMWEFYLAASEASFRWQDLMVFQIQITKRNDTVPITRGYIEKCEKMLAMHEMAHEPMIEAERAANEDAPANPSRRKVSGKGN